MDCRNIYSIVEKFYDGETSIEEEKFLKDFIKQGSDIPGEFEVLKNYFSFTDTEKKAEQLISFEDIHLERRRIIWNPRKVVGIISVAAMLVVLLSIPLKYKHQKAIKRINEITYAERKHVYNQTKEALLLISNNLNKGNNEIKRLAIFDEIKKQYIKN